MTHKPRRCPECEAEGKEDPVHRAGTILCRRHQYAARLDTVAHQVEREKQRLRQAERRRRYREEHPLPARNCPDCEAEGKDPVHHSWTVRCPEHHSVLTTGLSSNAKGGWCPDCEAEGVDPWHPGQMVYCGKHYARRWRRAAPERLERAREATRAFRATHVLEPKICPECEDEGAEDPSFRSSRSVCEKHYQRRYRVKKKEQAQPKRRKNGGKGRTALQRAYWNSQKEEETKAQ